MPIIDLSQPIVHGMPVYPGDDETSLIQTKYLDQDCHNNHRLQIAMHTGTHIDAPMHMTESNTYMSQWPLDSFMGRGCLLDVRGQDIVAMKPQYEKLVEENCILLLWTGQDKLYGSKSYYDCPVVHGELCELMVRKKIKMVGMDMPSPDRYPFPIHKRLLEQNIFIMENLTNLSQLSGSADFEVIALPLKIRADGAMTRAVARVRD